MYVTFKPDTFIRLTRSSIAIAFEAFERLTLDPSISLLRLIALVSTYVAITSFTLLVISSGGTITLATCVYGLDNFLRAFSTNFLPASNATVLPTSVAFIPISLVAVFPA